MRRRDCLANRSPTPTWRGCGKKWLRSVAPVVGDQRLDWEDKDVFTVPTWTFYEHVNSGDRPAFLFSFSDAPVMKALSLYRDQTGP